MRVIITGGGTGGHIYPGIAIAKKLKTKKGAEILFVGSRNGLENELVPLAGFNLKTITVRGFRRKLSLDTLVTFFLMFKGFWEAKQIIKEFKPDVVIGTGGYVCGPVVLAASLSGVPTMIHEQNSIPGVTNRILSKFVDKIAVSFVDSIRYLPTDKKKIKLTGNPVRAEIFKVTKEEGIRKLNLDPDKNTVLVFGGSRGAKIINDAMEAVIKENLGSNRLQIVHITGKKHYNDYIERLKRQGIDPSAYGNIKIEPYIYDMQYAMAASDLIVSRAGAMTIAEITALGKPSILVPLKIAANDHQKINALSLKKKHAAEVIMEEDLTGQVLNNKIKEVIFNEKKLDLMAQNSRKLGKQNATEEICKMIISLL